MGVVSNRACRALRLLKHAAEGGVAHIFALAAPVLLGLAGLGIDSAAFYNQQSRMQSVADSSALAIAKEMHLYLDKEAALEGFGRSRVETLLAETGLGGRSHSTDVRVDPKENRATVEIAMAAEGLLPVWGESTIVVGAEATTYGAERLCILGLHESLRDTIKADRAALITAPECAIQSNSKDPQGLTAGRLSAYVASFICTSGGYAGSSTSFEPTPETDCPILEDPLAGRVRPSVGGCDYLDFVADSGVLTIEPGHYCGGLKVSNKADVLAAPGVYVISGGKLEVANNAKLHGKNVSFYFADDEATLLFKDRADVELSAPVDGLMAGILLYEDPSAPLGRNFEIASDSVRELLGTIYLPRGVFKGDGRSIVSTTAAVDSAVPGIPAIGAASAYTVIVANRLDLIGVNLVINSDYAASDVPVPDGVGPNSEKVRLSQ